MNTKDKDMYKTVNSSKITTIVYKDIIKLKI